MDNLKIGIFIYYKEERKIEDYVNLILLTSYFLADKSNLKTGLYIPTDSNLKQLEFVKKNDLLSVFTSFEHKQQVNKENEIIIEIKDYKSELNQVADYDFGLILIEQNFYDVKEFAYKMVEMMNAIKESPLTSIKDYHILFIGDINLQEEIINSINVDIKSTQLNEIFQILTISGSKALLQIINGNEKGNNDNIINVIIMIYKGYLEKFYARTLDVFNYRIISLKKGLNIATSQNMIKYNEDEFKEILKLIQEKNYYNN